MERAELRLPTAAASAQVGHEALLAGARRVLPTLGAPSPLGTVVFSVCASQLEVGARNGAWGLAAGYSLMGYASRAADTACRLREGLAAIMRDELPVTRAGDVDYDRLLDHPAEIMLLVDRVTAIAAEPEILADLACIDRGEWVVFEAEAARRLRSHFLRRGASSSGLPAEPQAGHLLRLGVALRILDEVAGESPAGRVPARRQSDVMPYEAESWLASAASICMEDYGPEVEALLDAGVPGVLGLDAGTTLPDSDEGAIAAAHARFGYALREHEQGPLALTHSEDPYSHEAIALARLDDLPGLVRDVVRYGYCGGGASAIGYVPGASAAVRAAVLEEWSRRPHDGPSRTGDEIAALVRYGYLLRRALELRQSPMPAGVRTDAALRPEGSHGGD